MSQRIANVALLVRDYDESIVYYTTVLGFELVEDTKISDSKRWVLVRPRSAAGGCTLLLARASNVQQANAVGNQAGGRVFLFLETQDFDKDYASYLSRGVKFMELPRVETYGRVAVFEDLYGNHWDLVERTK